MTQRVIDTDIRTKIHDFSKIIQKTNVYSYKFKGEIKKLANARDKFDKSLSNFSIIQLKYLLQAYQAFKPSLSQIV